jgi:tetratricopeptide (TPR) repeat protein
MVVNPTINGQRAPRRPGSNKVSLLTVLKPYRDLIKGDPSLLGGVVVCHEAQVKLADCLPGATAIVITNGLRNHELQRLCSEPELIDLAISREGGVVFFKRPPRPEEMAGLVSKEFAVSRSAGLKMLARLKSHLPQDALGPVISEHLRVIADRFTWEEISAAEFDALLSCLGELGNHSLNRVFLKQFASRNADRLSWIETVFQFFRAKYPNERCYHEADGDLNVEQGSLAHAKQAYAEAQKLSPDNAALKTKVRNTEKALRRADAARRAELKLVVVDLWKKCAAGESAAAERLSSLALFREGPEGSNEVFELIKNEAEPDLVAFDTLEAAAERELPKLATRWHRLGEEATTEALARLAADKAVSPSRASLINSLLKDDSVEQLPPELLRNLAEAGHDPTHRWQAVCTNVYTKLFAEKHYLASDEHFTAGRLEESAAELRCCLQVNPRDEHARHNIVMVLAKQAEQALADNDREGASSKLDEALRVNQEYLPALALQMKLALIDHDCDRAISLIERMLTITRANLGGANNAFWTKLLGANLNDLGAAYFQRYLQSGSTDDLIKARTNLEEALKIGSRHEDHVYNLIKVKLWQCDLAAVVAWGMEYFPREQADPRKALDLNNQLQAYLERQGTAADKTAAEPLRQLLSAVAREIV